MNTWTAFKTLDNTTVYLQKGQIGAIEEIPESSRSQAYLKVYASGFKFMIAMKLEDFQKEFAQ